MSAGGPKRALIVGLGSIGRRHAANLRVLGRPMELVLLRREVRGDEGNRGLEARVTTDLASALAMRPDFAVIATPSARHVESLLSLLEAGVPCYVEKPVVSRRDQLDRLTALLSTLRAVPVTHAGCNFRHLPSLVRLRELVAGGAVGKVVRASLQAGQWLPDWRPSQDYRTGYSADSSQGGGVILDLIHEIDVARWIFGEFDRVVALAGKLSSLDVRSEDTACLVFGKRNDGPLVSIGLDYVSRRRVRRYEIVGEQGTLVWDFTLARLDLITRDRTETIGSGGMDFDVNQTYVTAMREFLDAVENGSPTSQDIFEGIRSTDLALRAREAAGL